ncbi:MAG: hypothetical protein HZB42_08035 [Sphingobacteriales bacterium]|nr:hypothetical protein [Sphingobacteriales bacterium]
MRKQILLLILAGIVAVNSFSQCSCGSSSSGLAYGESGSPSLTLKKNKWLFDGYSEYRSFRTHHHDIKNGNITNSDTIPENELRNARIALLGIRYGLTNNITLSLQQPYLWLNGSLQRADGLGDLLLISTIKLFGKNNFTGAFIAGVKFPTGKKSVLDNETNSVIGSGSYDPVGGIVLVKSFPKSFIRLNTLYKYGTAGFDKTKFGNFFSHNISFGYQLKGKEESCSTPLGGNAQSTDTILSAKKINHVKENISWNVTAGISGEWSSGQTKDHEIIQNTGGYSLFLQTGATPGFKEWLIPITFSIPLIQKLNGEQHQTNFRIKIGIIKSI